MRSSHQILRPSPSVLRCSPVRSRAFALLSPGSLSLHDMETWCGGGGKFFSVGCSTYTPDVPPLSLPPAGSVSQSYRIPPPPSPVSARAPTTTAAEVIYCAQSCRTPSFPFPLPGGGHTEAAHRATSPGARSGPSQVPLPRADRTRCLRSEDSHCLQLEDPPCLSRGLLRLRIGRRKGGRRLRSCGGPSVGREHCPCGRRPFPAPAQVVLTRATGKSMRALS